MKAENPVIRIVDDDSHIHDALAFVLESEGYEVKHFYSAESFLTEDCPSDFGCAVLDVRLGGMSGLALHKRMIEAGSKIPCIFLSAHGDVDMAVGAIEEGAVTFLTKPVRTEKLLAAIERALAVAASTGMDAGSEPSSQAALRQAEAQIKEAFESLSDRERQVALFACRGLTNRQIGERLEIAVRTVEFHRAGAMRKLGCHSAEELKKKLAAVPQSGLSEE